MDTKTSVLSYIEEERSKGKTEQEITHGLLDSGWHMDIIQRALDHHNQVESFLERHHAPKKIEGKLNKLIFILSKPIFWAGLFFVLFLLAMFI